MKLFKNTLVLALLALIVTSCGTDRTREQQVSAMIDKIDSPFFVASMDVQNLMDKSEVMEEGTIPFTYMEVLGFFLKEEVTGIDYSTKMQIIVGEGESFTPNFYAIFKIGDQEKWTDLIEQEAGADIVEEDGMKYAIKESEMYCVTWTDDIAVISNIPVNLMAMFSGKDSGEGKKMVTANMEIIKAATDGEINEDWVSFLTKDADLSMRYDGVGFYDYYAMMSIGEDGVDEMEDLITGMGFDVFMNFESGQMSIEVDANIAEDLLAELSFVPETGVDDVMLNYGKSESPLIVGSYNSDPDGAMDYFEGKSAFEFNKMMEDAEEFGLSMDDLKKSLNGQFVYMIDGVVPRTEVIDFGYGEAFEKETSYPISGVVIGLDDASYIKDKMTEMMAASQMDVPDDMMADMPELEVWENGVVKMGEAMIFLTDEVLFASNDTAWVNMIAEGNGVTVNNPEGAVNAKPFGLYIDISKTSTVKELQDLPAQYRELSEDLSISMSLQGGKIVMNMRDKSQNSLKVLTAAIGAALSDFEMMANPTMQEDLEQAVQDTEDAFNDLEDDLNDAIDNIDLDEIQDAVNDAFDDLNK